MILLDQISEVEVELDKVSQGQSNAVAIDRLYSVYQNISPILKELESNAIRRETCRHLPESYSLNALGSDVAEELQNALFCVDLFLATWQDLENKYDIAQQDVCRNTQDAVAIVNTSLETTINQTYTNWKAQVQAEINVSESDLDKQNTSPELKQNASEYRIHYQNIQEAIEVADPTLAMINRVESLRKKLLAARDKMEFNQPGDVVRLFKHLGQVGNGGHAPLSMLTKEVMDWIKEEGQEDHFYVGNKRVR